MAPGVGLELSLPGNCQLDGASLMKYMKCMNGIQDFSSVVYPGCG